MLLFSAVYLGFFCVVVTVADSIDLSGRMMSPVYTCMVVAAAYTGRQIVRDFGSARPALTAVAIALLLGGLLSIQIMRSAVWTTQPRAAGFDYSGRAWTTAPALDELRSLPPDTPLYSNWPQIVFYLTGRKAYPIAFAQCSDGCQALDADLRAIPDEVKEKAVLIWAHGEGRYECYDCLLAVVETHGFTSIHGDKRLLELFTMIAP